jgi:glucose-6-phosphate isomerase
MKSPLHVDMQFQQIDRSAWQELFTLANDLKFHSKRDDLFSGKKVNTSENRPALHTALRNLNRSPIFVDEKDIMPAIENVWQKMRDRCKNFTNITDIIHIGIGGSDFGPRLVCDALHLAKKSEQYAKKVHFLANIDGADLAQVLANANPQHCAVVIVSKAFTTLETLQNAHAVVSWLKAAGISSAALSQKLFAVTANPQLAIEFGIDEDHIFPFWDWVGGRFSVWSAVGLPIALKFGFEVYQEFLSGAFAMDAHFRNAPDDQNQALQMALALYFHQKHHHVRAQAIIPYAHALQLFPHWLQQLEMESNGKSAGQDGAMVQFSSPVVFGIPGTNAQHSFFQMLHQGPEIIPVDFIAVQESMSDVPQHQLLHDQLLANCLAQSEALAIGNGSKDNINHYYPGKRPNNLICLPRLDAFHLGALMALYEHRTFCLGILYGINSFDQPGVELGKKMAKPILCAMTEQQLDTKNLHPVTLERIQWLKSPSS